MFVRTSLCYVVSAAASLCIYNIVYVRRRRHNTTHRFYIVVVVIITDSDYDFVN